MYIWIEMHWLSFMLTLHHSDSVLRINYYKYFHPKEAFVPNGVLNRYDIHNLSSYVNWGDDGGGRGKGVLRF